VHPWSGKRLNADLNLTAARRQSARPGRDSEATVRRSPVHITPQISEINYHFQTAHAPPSHANIKRHQQEHLLAVAEDYPCENYDYLSSGFPAQFGPRVELHGGQRRAKLNLATGGAPSGHQPLHQGAAVSGPASRGRTSQGSHMRRRSAGGDYGGASASLRADRAREEAAS